MDREIIVQGRRIGPNHPPFIVAEMSGNHKGSLQRALKLVGAAAKAGAHALKLQTYTADTMTIDFDEREFLVSHSNSPWQGKSLYDLYNEAHTPWEWHKSIFERCRELGLICFSTPFDTTAVDFLEELHVPCYKIASFENIDLSLIKRVASTGKPLIISSGMASVIELTEAVDTAKAAGCKDLILLKCTSSYPASPVDSNILTIPHMRELFECQIGLSDHTLGIGVAAASVALGATVIEKHFTLSREEGGVDAAFSLEPLELNMLVTETERAWQSMGKIRYGASENEHPSLQFRRSLYVVETVEAGQPFSPENVRVIRPGFGLAPKNLDKIMGKMAKTHIRRGTPLSWDLID